MSVDQMQILTFVLLGAAALASLGGLGVDWFYSRRVRANLRIVDEQLALAARFNEAARDFNTGLTDSPAIRWYEEQKAEKS